MQFIIKSKLDIQIRVSKTYWKIISEIKHPSIAKYSKEIQETLQHPDEIRRSRRDSHVFLYYKRLGEALYLCHCAA